MCDMFVFMNNKRKDDEDDKFRTFSCNDGPANAKQYKFCNNEVTTTKYSLLTFFPKALFEQYRRVANLYFTLVAGLSISSFSPVNPYTTWAPLVLVVGISMTKEGHEDYKRFKVDKEVNARLVEVYRSNAFVEIPWREIQVGDVVKVHGDQYFPADLLLMSSSTPEGVCYIETMNLDGETNLKIKKGLEPTWQYNETNLSGFKGSVSCEEPNNSLYTFTGNLSMPGVDGKQQTHALNPPQILLRGSSLRNTNWVIGMAVFTGHDTKVMMNATAPPSKRSSLERQLDVVVIFMFCTLCLLCVIGSVTTASMTKSLGMSMWYMALDDANVPDQFNPQKPAAVGGENFLTLFILYAYLIPISLYVSIEMVKVAQTVFINLDRAMYHPVTDTPALARTSNLNEELGMVDTVLSDKTGTLTCNMMEFFKCSIAGVQYGTGVTEIERAAAVRKGMPLPAGSINLPPVEKGFNFRDKRLEGTRWFQEARPDIIKHFFRLLAICHTAIPEGNPTEDEIRYQAESPDEAAFVVASKRFGHFFFKRSISSITVSEVTMPHGRAEAVTYEILNIIEFSSTRKRMTVIFRQLPKGRITLYCKGADTVIYERLRKDRPEFNDVTLRHMEEYGEAGLRTLCLAYAELDEAEYAAWQQTYAEASMALENREGRMQDAAELIEKDLILLGATAIEDKLQADVGKTIEKLASAGIKIWVLTGDKMETAINIGFACSLLTNDQAQYVIDANAPVEEPNLKHMRTSARVSSLGDMVAQDPMAAYINDQMAEALKEICSSEYADDPDAFSLIIDGRALTYALRDDLKLRFLELATRCKAVICCRVSPLQKALVTLLVKSRGLTTLAIGDGANDVGMIQAADIGVGISGQEGLQAVMAADFAIAQFRFLERLLLVHGRYSYKRIARMVNYFFYKNVLFGFTLFWFNLFCFNSGQVFYNQWFMSGYNVLFTFFPVLAIGILDQDISPAMGARFSPLYRQGLRNEYFSLRAKAFWIIKGLLQSVLLFFGVCLAYKFDAASDSANGTMPGLWKMGETLFTAVVLVTLAEFAIVINYVTVLHAATVAATFVLWYIGALMIWGSFPLSIADNTWHLFLNESGGTSTYWLITLLLPVMCILPSLVGLTLKRMYTPEDHMIVQEVERLPGMHERMADAEAASATAPMAVTNSATPATARTSGGSEMSMAVASTGGINTRAAPRRSSLMGLTPGDDAIQGISGAVLGGRMRRSSTSLASADMNLPRSLSGHHLGGARGRGHTGFAGGEGDDFYHSTTGVMSPTIANLEAKMRSSPFAWRDTPGADSAPAATIMAVEADKPSVPGGMASRSGSRGDGSSLGGRSGRNDGSSLAAGGRQGSADFNSKEMMDAAIGHSHSSVKKAGGATHAAGRHLLDVQKQYLGPGVPGIDEH